MRSYESNFLIASCQEYDDDIEVQYTEDRSFKKKIARSCEPNRIQVFDVEFFDPYKGEDDKIVIDKIAMISKRDDEYFGDVLIGDECVSYYYTKYRGIYKKWPYLVMQALQTSEANSNNEDRLYV